MGDVRRNDDGVRRSGDNVLRLRHRMLRLWHDRVRGAFGLHASLDAHGGRDRRHDGLLLLFVSREAVKPQRPREPHEDRMQKQREKERPNQEPPAAEFAHAA